MKDFSHLDETGGISMVDVGKKDVTEREAVAAATVRMSPETLKKLADRALPKGDVLTTAKVAGPVAGGLCVDGGSRCQGSGSLVFDRHDCTSRVNAPPLSGADRVINADVDFIIKGIHERLADDGPHGPVVGRGRRPGKRDAAADHLEVPLVVGEPDVPGPQQRI